jgi:hypothetical protein
MQNQLRLACKTDLLNADKFFVPLDTLDAIVYFDAVKRHLIENVPTCNAEDTARRICGCCETDSATPPLPPYRKIFAVLVLFNKEKNILDFIKHGTHDGHLPFIRDQHEGENFSLVLIDEPERVRNLPCLADMNLFDIQHFDKYQWYMLAPYFARVENGPVPLYVLHDRTIFPWTFYGKENRDGGYSYVRRVDIHPEHHNLVCI